MLLFIVCIYLQALDDGVGSENKLPGPPIKRRKSATTDSQFVQVLQQAGSAFQTIASKQSEKPPMKETDEPADVYQRFGAYIASKLRSMGPEKASQAEDIIMEALIQMPT